MTATDPTPPKSFEDAIGELEALVSRMESGRLALDESVRAYQRGVYLAGFCRRSLDEVRQQVSVLEGELLRPMAGDEAGEGDAGDGEGGAGAGGAGGAADSDGEGDDPARTEAYPAGPQRDSSRSRARGR